MRILLLFLFAGMLSLHSQEDLTAEKIGKEAYAMKMVKQTAYDYIDTFYMADTTLAYKAVHKDLRKVGWWYSNDKGEYSDKLEMPFKDLVALAKRWNADGSRDTANAPRIAEVIEVNDKIAIAKVTALWGIDYLNMVNMEGEWKIINIIWQSEPKYSMKVN